MTSIDITENGSSAAGSIAQQVRNSVGLASETEMAAILQVSEETLATWRSKRRGPPAIKLGKKVFYMINDFSQWVMAEVEKQSVPTIKRPRAYKPVVHVDENQPGVHVQY